MQLFHTNAVHRCSLLDNNARTTARAACRLPQHAQPRRSRWQWPLQSDVCPAVLNTEVSTADSWALTTRAAVLSLKVEQLNNCIQEDPENSWLAVCDPQRLFALRELCTLLELDVPAALQLVKQQPDLLDTPSRSLESNVQGLQALLPLPRADLLRLLYSQPVLLIKGRPGVEAQVTRVSRDLGLTAPGPDGDRLLLLLARMGSQGLEGDPNKPVEKVRAFSSALHVSPSLALVLLQPELMRRDECDVSQLLSAAGVSDLAGDWLLLSEEVGLKLSEVMGGVARQLMQPDASFTLGSCQQLRSDISALQGACQLQPATVCQLLLSAPRLACVPACFWKLLLQYMLFIVPHWRRQLESMPAHEAGTLLAELFTDDGLDLQDVVAVSSRDALFATADCDYNHELAVLEALLDQGIAAPRFTTPTEVTAGRVWRLLYLCNPRLAAAHTVQQDTPEHTSSSTWGWVLGLQLPLPLVNQMREQGALSCDLPRTHAATGSSAVAGTGNTLSVAAAGCEAVESLRDVLVVDAAGFCAQHPGYAHWLSNTVFELEWGNSKTAVPAATWDV